MTPHALSQELVAYVHARLERVISRFFPDLRFAGYFAGHRIGPAETAEALTLLAGLRGRGIDRIAGYAADEALRVVLGRVDGAETRMFSSYRIAEVLLTAGAFAGNPLLAELGDAQRDAVRRAVDPKMFDAVKRTIIPKANNYWLVLARCEYARERLGLAEDPSILALALERSRQELFRATSGFFDDSRPRYGRFDLYSYDVQLFAEPFRHLLGVAETDRTMLAHVRLLESLALENGAAVAWGRSVGANSVLVTLELAALALQRGLAADPARMLGLAENAFRAFDGWIDDDLISAHRGRMTDGYRGPHRLVEMTLDCLIKVLHAAGRLAEVAPVVACADRKRLFPAVDDLTRFDGPGAGVWMYRDRDLAFQLPFVRGYNSDYLAHPRFPGVFEVPVDSAMACGVPRLAMGTTEFTCSGVPAAITKAPRGITATWDAFTALDDEDVSARFAGARTVRYEVRDGAIAVDEDWSFDAVPDLVSLQIPESAARLRIAMRCQPAPRAAIVTTDGIAPWRSFWGPLTRVHQFDFVPARRIAFSYTLSRDA
ncbi:MAG TPA: hypothetical protein VEL07_17045 [Planctomycetota bacterium]|nr:hypothetical protein [Planctomycetota bacterium]